MSKLSSRAWQVVAWPAWILSRPVVWPALGVYYLISSFRFWLVVILLVMVVLIAYHVAADHYTPISTDAYVQAYVVQVAPQVGGQVVRVYAKEGEAVKAGATLFELDERPFRHKIAYLEAKLIDTTQKIKQLHTEKAAAEAEHTRLRAEADYAATVYKQEAQIYEKVATTERKYQEARDKDRAARAAVDKAAVGIQHVEESLAARIGKEHALVAMVKAELEEAQLNLTYTRVVAACDGVVTDLQLREGAYVHTGQAAMTIIDTTTFQVVANFRENALRNLEVGQPALVALQGKPGVLMPARVVTLGKGVQQGQGVPSGKLPEVKGQTTWVQPPQRFQVRLVLDAGEAVPLRVGMTGSVTVYTEPEGRVHEVTRGLHQLIAWVYYL